jgi:spore germination protein KC
LKLTIIKSIIIFITVSFLLTACYDSREIDSEVYSLTIGIDKGNNYNNILLTIQYPSYKGSGGSSGAGEAPTSKDSDSYDTGEVGGTVVTSVEAPSILGGLDMLNTSVPRKISLTQTKILVFSEDYAKSGVSDSIASLARFRDTRRNMKVLVCKGKAQDFIKESKPAIGDSLSKSMDMLLTQSFNTGYSADESFHKFYQKLLSPYESAIATYSGLNNGNIVTDPNSESALDDTSSIAGRIPRKGGNKWELAGSAIFKGDKMVGTLNTEETRYFLILTNNFHNGVYTIDDNKGSIITMDIHPGRKIESNSTFKNGVPYINLYINLEADVNSIQGVINYLQPDKLSYLNEKIKQNIDNSIKDLIVKTQKEFQSDIFGFGHKISKNFKTIPEWEAYKWNERYPNLIVEIKLDVNVRRGGIMIGNSKYWNLT